MPAPLAITADDQTMTYGGTLPALSATFTGLVNGDTPGTVAGLDLATVSASSHVGSYAINASGAVDADYSITLIDGTLTIAPAPLTIMADNQSMVVGSAVPPLTASYDGLVNGDNPAALTTPPTLSTMATSAAPIGFYAITIGGAVDPDYAINYVDGTLNVALESPTTGIAASVAAPVFGQSVTFTASVTGDEGTATGSVQFQIDGVNSGTPVRLSGGLAELTTAGLSAGSHSITAFYTSDSNNYTDNSTTTPFTENVGPADTVTTVADLGGTYTGSAFQATSGVTGAGGLSTIASSLDYYDTDTSTDLGSNAPINAGHYTVTATYNGDANHLGSTSGALAFIIGQANATVSVSGYTGVYDGAYHGATGSESGLGGENAGTLTLGSTFKDAPGGTAYWVFTGNGNYKNQSGEVAIAISKATASIAVTPYSVTYDGRAHTATGTATGVESPSPTNLGSLLNLSGTTHANPGSYTDTWTFAGNMDYASASGTVIDVIASHPVSVTSITAVSPNPRNSVVSSVDITFSEPINTSSLTSGALVLSRSSSGTVFSTSSGMTITLVSGTTSTYAIGGLSTITSAQGQYTLTVNAFDIKDQNGLAGRGSASSSWLMDTTPPKSTVNPLPARETSLIFPVSVTGSDLGSPASGVSSYDIFVSINGGAWIDWTNVPAASPIASYSGQSNTTYAFYSIAHDYAGNTELKTPAIAASTYVPDLTTPVTAVGSMTGSYPSTVNSTTGLFTLNITGSDPGGGVLTYFEVFVSVDSGPYTMVNGTAIPAGPPDRQGNSHAIIPYQGLTDGAAHHYAFYSIGFDSAGNVQSMPATPNLSLTETFAQPAALQVTNLLVSNGAVERSYIRYLDIAFNESDSQSGGALTQIVKSVSGSASEILIYKYDLNGDASSKTAVSLAGVSVSVIDHAIELDFHAGGIGGSPNTTAADGYYEVDIKLPNGQTAVHHFDRLLGDVSGDGVVDQNDLNDIATEIGLSSQPGMTPLNADVTGDGSVTALDLTLATRSKGRKLGSGLSMG